MDWRPGFRARAGKGINLQSLCNTNPQYHFNGSRPAIGKHPPAATLPHEGEDTTHYSIVDGMGNAVSTTYTLNSTFGTGITAEGTGFLLNNELLDFALAPGRASAFDW